MEDGRVIAWDTCCIHEAFERVVDACPEREALVCGAVRWTYRELNEQANRYAHALIGHGIRLEEPVPVALPRCADQIAAILGVLKAGGAYVPIVDNQPVPRLQTMVRDARARFMIGDPKHLSALHAEPSTQIERLITSESIIGQATHNPERACINRQLAYIMYTSGSTGEPKGVMIEHDGVLRLVHDQWFMPTGPDTHYLSVSSLGFDASTIEIYAALLHGAKVALTTQRVPEPAEVARLIRDEGIRAVWIAFGFFSSLLEADASMFEPIDVVMTGGEPVTAERIRDAQRALPSTRFVNSYGPTECTALSSAYEIPPLDEQAAGMLPIGRALRGMRLRVVDEQGNELRTGGIGELLISGVGISRGYLNAPELTAERFVQSSENGREYRSGDLVEVLGDGELMFRGRIDSQVKLRGNRFELGEVESVALSCDGIRSCVACVVDTGSGSQLALLAAADEHSPEQSTVRAHLASLLPEYMVPGVVVLNGSIPLTRNGKADRAAARAMIESEVSSTAPTRPDVPDGFSDETQARLAGLMSDVLGCAVRSKHERFLDLGGHSLRAVVLCSRIHDQFGVRIPISSIYEHPSVAQLAWFIDAQIEFGVSHPDDQPIERKGDGQSGQLSFNQQRLWMLDQIYPGDPSYTISLRLEHGAALDRESFDRAWMLMCDRHEVLRACIRSIDGSPSQVICEPAIPIWRDARSSSATEIEAMITREASRGFDLETGPLARCIVFNGDDSATLVISMHHIISDAWSCEILQRELRQAYQSFLAGSEPRFPVLPVRYSDFARWERALPERPAYQENLAYWTGKLEHAAMLRIPADFVARSKMSNTATRAEVVIENEELSELRAAATESGVTPFVYILAVFKVWLSRLTLERDIVVGSPIANRERTEVEGVIGFFMETLALRNSVNPDDTLAQVISRVRAGTLEAFDHRDVPFQHIVEALGLQGSADHSPLFEVFFNHIAIRLHESNNDEQVLAFSETEIDNHTAKFDLTCYIFEQDECARVVFNARRSRFSPATIEWYLAQFVSLLSQSTSHLGTRISEIPIALDPISPPGPAHVPAPQLPIDVRTDGSIIEHIEHTVHNAPHQVAARTPSEQLTYKALWAQSELLASALQARSIGRGDRVLILIDDPIQTCIATLAVLRLGAVYVPTDPLWPSERTRQIVQLSEPKVALTDRSGSDLGLDCLLIDVHQTSDTPRFESVPVDADDPAYIMFTSGTTGTPRGVLQTHRGVVGHMKTFAHSISLQQGESLLQLSSFAFDASVMDMFACWFSGSTLCVAQAHRSSASEILSWARDQRVDVVHGAPSLLRWLTIDISEPTEVPGVRAVVLGGEPSSDHDLDSILSVFPSCDRFINGLGLTESSLTLQHRVNPRLVSNPTSTMPVGFPVEGTAARLVDESGNPSSPSGEIEIISDRIARAYVHGPGTPDTPIGESCEDTGSTRRFRTGDLGTIRHDGAIMHLGRRDDQVQVRGCRVEPAEVSAAIRGIDGVTDCAVIAVPVEEGGHELTAYIACSNNLQQGEAIRLLSDQLPSYMIPSRWVRVAQIPRVGGGKVDRHALPLCDTLVFDRARQRPLGRVTDRTRVIMRAFGRVLETDSISPDDHFFHMGGNSLRAIKLFTLLREQLGTTIPISVIYRAPTPAQLDAEIERAGTEPTQSHSLIKLTTGESDRSVIVLPGIGGHPLGFAPLIDRISSPVGFVGVQYPDEPTLDQIGHELPLLARWVIEQLDLKPNDPIPDMIGYSFGGSLGTEIAMQLLEQGREPGNLILLDAHLPFGLPKKGRIGTARAHFARIVEGHETSRLAYIGKRLMPGAGVKTASPIESEASDDHGDRVDLRRYRAVARINRQMVMDYRPTLRYHAPVLLLRANQPEWLRFHHDDGFNGFSAIIASEHISRVDINAGHLQLFDPDPAGMIAREVDQRLGVQVH